MNLSKLTFFFFGLFFCCLHVAGYAQIVVTSPIERAVYQRDADGFSDVTISGSYSVFLDRVEVQATPIAVGQGVGFKWSTLLEGPSGGVFSGSIRLLGGWYRIEIRGVRKEKVVGDAVAISRLGVGEVLIIAGQSNAQGMDYTSPAATDDRVNFISYDNEILNSYEDLPPPIFAQLGSDTHTMGLRGHGSWCWGILGDSLARKLNVPILFVNTAWDGTALMNWVLSSHDLPTWDVHSGLLLFPRQMPYANLRLSFQQYVKQYGARCLLWMQGESDNFPLKTSFDDYKSGLENLISKLESDIGVSVCWVIARTSRKSDQNNVSTVSSEVIAAQNAVINSLPQKTYPGPETDNLYENRGGDGTHFWGKEGVTILANAWNESLSNAFFENIKPISNGGEPKISTGCGPDSASLKLDVAGNYFAIEWVSEIAGNTLTCPDRTLKVTEPGKYYAKVRDIHGNTLRTQTVVVSFLPKPSQPIIAESLVQQVCSNGSVIFSVNDQGDQYRWYKEGSTQSVQEGVKLIANQSGKYFVRGENVFGCMSRDSQSASLVVQPNIPVPSIVKTAPFSVQAKIETNDFGERYEWLIDQKRIQDVSENTLYNITSGEYSVRAKVDFTLAGVSLTCFSDYSDKIVINQGTDFEVIVFPNPGSSDNIFVETNRNISDAKVEIYSANGNLLFSRKQQLKGPFKIPNGILIPGKYVIIVSGDTMKITKYFVLN